MITPSYDISKVNYMALPALLPGVLMFYRSTDTNSIIECVVNLTGVPLSKLQSKKRNRNFVEARMIAMWLLRKHTTLSLKFIGQIFGNRDHTTIIHSIRTVNALIDSNEQFKQQLLLIENKLSA